MEQAIKTEDMRRRNKNKEHKQNINKAKKKEKYVRAYKKHLVNMRHPKETSKPDPKLLAQTYPFVRDPDEELSQVQQEIIELERAYGFGARINEAGHIITGEGKTIIGRHFE